MGTRSEERLADVDSSIHGTNLLKQLKQKLLQSSTCPRPNIRRNYGLAFERDSIRIDLNIIRAMLDLKQIGKIYITHLRAHFHLLICGKPRPKLRAVQLEPYNLMPMPMEVLTVAGSIPKERLL